MRAHGPTFASVLRRGLSWRARSAMQFIETSSITRPRRRGPRPLLRRRLLLPAVRPGRRGRDRGRALWRHAARVQRAPSDDRRRARARRAGRRWSASPTRSPTSATPLRGATRPHRGTWLIWSVLAIVVCLSQRADGASWSLRHGRHAGRPHQPRSSSSRSGRGEGGVERGRRAHDRDRARRRDRVDRRRRARSSPPPASSPPT